jgi:hypothetical protein
MIHIHFSPFTCQVIISDSVTLRLYKLSLSPTGKEPVPPTGCEHCPPGYQCNPIFGACIKGRKSTGSSTVTFFVSKSRPKNNTKIDKWCVAVLF